MILHKLLFPTLAGKWGHVNFNEEALAINADPSILNPTESTHWVEQIHKSKGIDYSYGGYFEDRAFLMRGQYQKPGETWHLGIDYTIAEGTPVHLPVDAVLRFFAFDPDQYGGWGTKAIFETSLGYLIFGHLENRVLEVKSHYKAGDLISTIAGFHKNGGWFPHLHVQAVRKDHKLGSTESIDGYSALYTGIDVDFPRPDAMIKELLVPHVGHKAKNQ